MHSPRRSRTVAMPSPEMLHCDCCSPDNFSEVICLPDVGIKKSLTQSFLSFVASRQAQQNKMAAPLFGLPAGSVINRPDSCSSTMSSPCSTSSRPATHPPPSRQIAGRCLRLSCQAVEREQLSYRTAGVDIDAGNELVRRIQKLNPQIGGFSGFVPFGELLALDSLRLSTSALIRSCQTCLV